jgi:2'-5' RNA ligase
MRAFIAFEVPMDIKEYLMALSGQMAARVPGVKWVRKEGIHITMKFFGEIDKKEVPAMYEALSCIAGKYPAFEADIVAIDAFPDKLRARVIIVRLEKGIDNLKSIFNDIESTLHGLGIEKESRPFTPHLTLGRRKTPGPLLERETPLLETRRFALSTLTFFESTLMREGPVYTPLWQIKLGGTHD